MIDGNGRIIASMPVKRKTYLEGVLAGVSAR